MTTRKPPHPRCPHCSSGRIRLTSERVDEHYRLFYCANCGAAHGVVPDLVEEKSFFDEVSLADDDATPRCPTHDAVLKRVTVPPGYKESGKVFWVCMTKGCSYKEEVEDQPAPAAPKPRAVTTTKAGEGRRRRDQHRREDRQEKGLSIFSAKRAIVDLVNKTARQNRRLTPNQIGAMIHGSGGLYSETVLAPLCPNHSLPMEQITVPEIYREAGKRMWVCPYYSVCEYWEWVKKKSGDEQN